MPQESPMERSQHPSDTIQYSYNWKEWHTNCLLRRNPAQKITFTTDAFKKSGLTYTLTALLKVHSKMVLLESTASSKK